MIMNVHIHKASSFLTAVTETEIVNLLLGNNNCTCVNVERRGGLSFALSNPDPDKMDIVCRVHGTECYSPTACRTFNDSGLPPFFHVCDNPPENTHVLCFGNISERLSHLRLDLFALKRVICLTESLQYATREYFRSFELNGKLATSYGTVNLMYLSF